MPYSVYQNERNNLDYLREVLNFMMDLYKDKDITEMLEIHRKTTLWRNHAITHAIRLDNRTLEKLRDLADKWNSTQNIVSFMLLSLFFDGIEVIENE